MRRLSVLLLLVLALAVASCGSVRGPVRPSPAPGQPTAPGQPAAPAAPPSAPPSAALSTPAAATTPAVADRTLLPGMSGADVAVLQRRLTALHYYPGPADGRFGNDTLAAVWAFRAVQGLPARDAADDTAYAIHGSGDVPRRPASHGCVRIPMVIAEFFHTLVPAPGTPVYIRR